MNVETALFQLLGVWRKTHNLPHLPPENLLNRSDLSAEQRRWLKAFSVLWDISV